MTSSENHSVSKQDNHFVQKFLIKDGIENAPNNNKSPKNQVVISINNPSPIFHPQGYDIQQIQTPIPDYSSNFSNLCNSPDVMDTLTKKILQHIQNN